MVEYNGILKITLICAKQLPCKDINGYSDPYFIFQLGNQKLKSKGKFLF